jgi:hypothetical protein
MSVSAGHLVSPTIDVRKRTLFMACIAHALHDGYTDLTYVMLPVWQADFGLSFTTLAAMRGVYVGAMAGLQLPAGRLAQRWSVVPFSSSAPRLRRWDTRLPGRRMASSACARRCRSQDAGRARNIRLPRGWFRAPTESKDAARWASIISPVISANRRCRPQSRCCSCSCPGGMRCGSSPASALWWRRRSHCACQAGAWPRSTLLAVRTPRQFCISVS